MSIRHQMRALIEETFKLAIDGQDFPKGEDVNMYVILIPKSDSFTEEEIEVYEFEVNTEDAESVKKFLDRATRVSLEGDVKNLRFYGFAYESKGNLNIVAKERNEDFEEIIIERLERMREEI